MVAASRRSGLTFDATRRVCYTGYVTQAIVNNLAPLLFIVFQTRFAVPLEMLGRLVLVSPVVDAMPVPSNGRAARMSLLHSFYC